MADRRANKLAVVLSCGVALGAAHLGILKSLFKQGMRPDIYIGSSMGALVAAMMAIYDDVDYVSLTAILILSAAIILLIC